MTIAAELQAAAQLLAEEVRGLRFSPPVTHVYRPLDYAWAPHAAYIATYGHTRKQVVFLGMNPGPFGMAQTGVPFGEVRAVRDFLKISGPVGRPEHEHPERPVQGFACTRAEVSGMRLWGAVAAGWGTAEAFFRRHYVANYCPLAFVAEGGKNFTPDKLPPAERGPLLAACDRHLRRMVELLDPAWVIGIGAWAEKRAAAALASRPGSTATRPEGGPVKLGKILHPSPASPLANHGWAAAAAAELTAIGLCPLSDMVDQSGLIEQDRGDRRRSARA